MSDDDDTDKWVRRLNALADELDGDAAMMHPSAWHVALEGKIAKWKKLAKQGGDHAEV